MHVSMILFPDGGDGQKHTLGNSWEPPVKDPLSAATAL
jgi:hypothetical protein